jgi:uncharacterized membrane protein YfcA
MNTHRKVELPQTECTTCLIIPIVALLVAIVVAFVVGMTLWRRRPSRTGARITDSRQVSFREWLETAAVIVGTGVGILTLITTVVGVVVVIVHH